MSYELVYAPEALEDLDRIWFEVWEAFRDFETVDHYVEGLREAIRKKNYPKTGHPLSFMGEFTGIYMVFYKVYTAFYRVRESRIKVGRVLYSKSDYMKILLGEVRIG